MKLSKQTTIVILKITLKVFKKQFEEINKNYTTNVSRITEAIKFDDYDTDEIKAKIIEFAAEQQKVANSDTLKEKLLTRATNIWLIGDIAKKKFEEGRKQRLNEETVSGIVGEMYRGLKKQAEDVEQTEMSLLEIKTETERNLNAMEKLGDALQELIDSGTVPQQDYMRTIKMRTQVKVMTEKSRDKVDTLNITIPATRGLLEMIYQHLPTSEADLLSDIAMSSGVSKINKLSQNVKEMKELSEIVSTGIWEKTQTTLKDFIEINSISDKDIKQIENNAIRRNELYASTLKAIDNQRKQTLIASKTIDEIAEKSKQQRLSLPNPSNLQ